VKILSDKILNRQHQLVTEMIGKLAPYVLEKGHPADRVIARYFKDHRELGSRDRRFLTGCFFAYFRWFGWTQPLGLSLFEAASLSMHLDQIEIHPALIDEKKAWLPLGGKTLDEKQKAVREWFPEALSLEKLDLIFPNSEQSMVPPEGQESLFYETLQQRPPTWLRLRNAAFKQTLTEAQIPFEEHSHISYAISIPAGRSLGTLGHRGQFEVQDIASQAVGVVAAPEPGSDWWDACAGAGGKALQLADAIGRTGQVLASDIRTSALQNCKKRARTDGISHVRIQPHNLEKDEPFTKCFDGVLVDAPCSGGGTWSRNPDARWRTHLRDPAQKRNLQLRMLHHAAACVKPDGILIYAVCTLTRTETTEVLRPFLEDHSDFALEPFAHPLTGEPTPGSIHIWPWEGPGDGMFIARLRRST